MQLRRPIWRQQRASWQPLSLQSATCCRAAPEGWALTVLGLLQELEAQVDALDLPAQEAELAAAQADLAAAEGELAALSKAADQLGVQETGYWHAFNDFQARLATHVDDRDGMLNKVLLTWAQTAQTEHSLICTI